MAPHLVMQTVLVGKKNGKNNRSLWDRGFVFEQLGGILNS